MGNQVKSILEMTITQATIFCLLQTIIFYQYDDNIDAHIKKNQPFEENNKKVKIVKKIRREDATSGYINTPFRRFVAPGNAPEHSIFVCP